MKCIALRLAVLAGFLGMLAVPAQADGRVALVVGNSAYQNVLRLDNPRNDAKLMADTLRTLGFTLVGGGAQLDLDKTRFDSAVQSFGNQLSGADVALFYYAGHGVQVRGSNYLVPVGANPTKEADVDFQMVDVTLVLRQMEGSGTRLNLVILDACRNNPFGGRGLRATAGGLAQMPAPEGTLISYATQPGSVAQDGTDGNSPYTKALAQTMRLPGLGIFDAFNKVGLAVKRATGGSQQPWVSSSPIDGSFYFAGAPAATAPTLPLASGPAADEMAWGLIKDTRDADQLRRFVEQFPASPRRSEAAARLVALESAKVAALPPTPPIDSPANVPRRIVVNFDALNALGNTSGMGDAALAAYLAKFGITITSSTAQRIAVFDDRDIYAGKAVRATSGHNVFMQSGGNPVRYTLEFATSLKSISFDRVRLVAGPSGVSHPVWKAVAQDAAGRDVAVAEEAEIRSMVDVPARTFTLSGAGIKTLVVSGDHRGFAGFSNLVLDNLVLVTE